MEKKGVGEIVGICFTGIQLIDEVQRVGQPRYNVREKGLGITSVEMSG